MICVLLVLLWSLYPCTPRVATNTLLSFRRRHQLQQRPLVVVVVVRQPRRRQILQPVLFWLLLLIIKIKNASSGKRYADSNSHSDGVHLLYFHMRFTQHNITVDSHSYVHCVTLCDDASLIVNFRITFVEAIKQALIFRLLQQKCSVPQSGWLWHNQPGCGTISLVLVHSTLSEGDLV